MTKSTRYRWQIRWRLIAPGYAQHVSGLEVRFGDGPMRSPNENETRSALARVHGPHNAPVMLARLLKEARILYAPTPPV